MGELACLIKDANDFFDNIFNIKIPKRFVAIRQIKAAVHDGKIQSLQTLQEYVLPLAIVLIIDKPQAELQR